MEFVRAGLRVFRKRRAGRPGRSDAGLRCARRAALVTVLVLGAGAGVSLGAVPAPWAARDVGGPSPSGAATENQGSFAISASGADIWDTSDEFHFVYQPVSGDVEIIARVDSLADTDRWAKAGVMIRGDLSAGAAHAFALVSAGQGIAFQRRPQAWGSSVHTAGEDAGAPRWVRLVRAGSRVTAYSSSDGTSWRTIGSDTIALGATAYVGLAVTSHHAGVLTYADISNVSVTASTAPSALPSPQQAADIGGPAIHGSTSYAQGAYTITAGGTDIWSTSDEFQFVYQPVSGDVDLVARVAGLGYADRWSKAGVMIRESLAANSRHAFALVSAGSGYAFQRRVDTGGYSDHTWGGFGVAPGWVRLVRSGSQFQAFRSPDGRTWTPIGSDTIPMADSVYVGLAVTSHDAAQATTALIDQLTVTQSSSSSNSPPTVAITAPGDGATITAPANLTVTASAADPENRLARVEFYLGTTRVGSDTTAPYSAVVSSLGEGTYSLSAIAYDADGASATSAPVTISVSAPTASAPRSVAFHESADHDTLVTSYRLDVFQSGADPVTARPIASSNLGKPAPDSNGDITVDRSTFFSGFASGNYLATVSAIGSGGESRSAAVAFSR